MKKLSIFILLIFLISNTSCFLFGGGDVDLTSEGFTKLQNYSEDGAEITIYTGMKSGSEALEIFTDWAIDNGWEKTNEEIEYFSTMSGVMFEKGDEIMHINVVDATVSSTVMITKIPRDIDTDSNDETPTPKTPTPTPEPEMKTLDDLSDIARYVSELDFHIANEFYSYTFLGETNLDGNNAQYFIVEGSQGQIIEIWSDDTGEEIYQVILNDIEVDENEAMQATMFINYLSFFFSKDFVDNHVSDDFQMEVISKDLGSGYMNVETYTYEFMGVKMVRELLKIDDYYISLSMYEVLEDGNRDGWEINKLVLK